MKNNLHVVIILAILFSPILIDLIRLIYRIRLGQIPSKKLKKYLLRIGAFGFAILTITITLNHTNYLNYESPIPYSEINRITFENFRGLEFFKKKHNGNRKFAYIVTSIEEELNDEEIYIEAFFHPSRSFVFNRNSYSDELLRHELYHFKITELFARKIRKEISLLRIFDKQLIQSIIESKKLEERQFQKLHDFDTYHSYILKEQKKYESQIDSLIYSLKEFSHPTTTIK